MRNKDQEYAKKLLEHRKHGYSFRVALRSFRWRYALSGTIFALVLFMLYLDPSDPLLCILAGMYIGTFLRDFGWFRGIKRSWPFSEKITDWDKVEAIANGETPPQAG